MADKQGSLFQTFWLFSQVSNLGNYNDLWKNSPSIPMCRGDTLCSFLWLELSSKKPYGLQNKLSKADKLKSQTNQASFWSSIVQVVTIWAYEFSLAWPITDLIFCFSSSWFNQCLHLDLHSQHNKNWHLVRPSHMSTLCLALRNITSFNLTASLMRKVLFLFPFCRWGNWHLDQWGALLLLCVFSGDLKA